MASKKRRPYVRVAEQVKQGEDLLVDPLDYLILDTLPDEGTLMGGVAPIGETVRNLANTTFKDKLTPQEVAGRLNAMQYMGHTVAVRMQGKRRNHGWQITKLGKRALAEWKLQREAS